MKVLAGLEPSFWFLALSSSQAKAEARVVPLEANTLTWGNMASSKDLLTFAEVLTAAKGRCIDNLGLRPCFSLKVAPTFP
jgi:hypothetical protein